MNRPQPSSFAVIGKRIVAGAVAGAVGTVAMDALWYRRAVEAGDASSPLAWEFGGVANWDDVSAPGQVGKFVLDRLVGPVPDRCAGPVQNAVHWATGVSWGVQLAIVAGAGRRRPWRAALALGPVAWLTSYVTLPMIGVYKPMWEYEVSDLAQDLSAHILYGATTAVAFSIVRRAMTGP